MQFISTPFHTIIYVLILGSCNIYSESSTNVSYSKERSSLNILAISKPTLILLEFDANIPLIKRS